MRIAIIGATGRTGRHLLEQGIRRGYAMTAFARHPETLADSQGLAAVVQGEGLNLDDIRRAVRGQDAVIVGVGNRDIVRNLIAAMREEGIRRLVCLSAYPVAARRPRLLVAATWQIFRSNYSSLAIMEREVMASGLDWTIVRPTRLIDGIGVGKLRRERDGRDFIAGPFSIQRADLAMELLDSVESADDIGAAIAVTGARNR
jgi:putative NADH-flavin reductase